MDKEVGFEQLREERQALGNAVLSHADSVWWFRDDERPWFRRLATETHGADLKPDQTVRHLTTTASSLESLADVPDHIDQTGNHRQLVGELAEQFATAALEAKVDEWDSEGSAYIYCRVRTLPVLLDLISDDVLKAQTSSVTEHLAFVWDRLDAAFAEKQGIAEMGPPAEQPGGIQDKQGETSQDDGDRRQYPPNAFHTYWALRLLDGYRKRHAVLPDVSSIVADIGIKEEVARLWARRTMAAQAALIEAKAERIDAHQLAWALIADALKSDSAGVRLDSQHEQLQTTALRAFFSEQRDDGSWPLYQPLFHYAQAGNAYCYTFETLAELLRPALRNKTGKPWRDRLRAYAGALIDAWHHARDTALETAAGRYGWCSGHHPHRTHAEGWATAAVFSYLQNLRCLIGYWTAEEAARSLAARRSRWPAPDEARQVLADRGQTWPAGDKPSAGQQLASMFLHPLDALKEERKTIDPDTPLVREARSAVLFGPPGGSKTTMVDALAGALNWEYIEVHASHFLRDGMDQVPARADEIFSKLMELDRCVILFDEIDELIRHRQGESDPFGRFLTTSMLPKLAQLWEQRRVLFFVATNDIDAADSAIKRSQRFDASIFVTPPSFAKKYQELVDQLGENPPGSLTEEAVSNALAHHAQDEHPLGNFALLRWDQIAELAHRIQRIEQAGQDNAGHDAAEIALKTMGKQLVELEWRPPESMTDADKSFDAYKLFLHYSEAERRDYRNRSLIRLTGDIAQLPLGWQIYRRCDGYIEITAQVEASLKPGGENGWSLVADGFTAIDTTGLFEFESQQPTTPVKPEAAD